ncbi:MAG: ABC transporter substrate-binding protein [Paracoccaceae bacterium]
MKHILIATTALTLGVRPPSRHAEARPRHGLTGGLAPYDAPVVEGIRIGVDEINAAGGIGGSVMIEMVERDVRSDAAQTAIAVQELVDEGVEAIVLPCDADPSLAAAGIVAEAGIPAISTCASSPTLPLIGGDFVFANFPATTCRRRCQPPGPSSRG